VKTKKENIMKHTFLILITLFAFAISGCNMLVRLPIGGSELIPTEKFPVNEAIQDGAAVTVAALTLAPSSGSLLLAVGANGLASGEIQYNVADWKPVVAIDGNTLKIEQHIPENNISSTPKDSLNAWDLQLADALTSVIVTLTTGNYTLTFADTLPNGTTIDVSAGVGNLRLEFPIGVIANLEVQRGPANIATEGVWSQNGKIYTSGDSGPVWTVKVDIGVGNLTLASQ
jgi:hypothetical protein